MLLGLSFVLAQNTFNITWNSIPSGGGLITDLSNNNVVTNTAVPKPQGSTNTFSIEENIPYELDSIVVDGQLIDLNNDPNVGVSVGYYSYTVSNLQHDIIANVYFSIPAPPDSNFYDVTWNVFPANVGRVTDFNSADVTNSTTNYRGTMSYSFSIESVDSTYYLDSLSVNGRPIDFDYDPDIRYVALRDCYIYVIPLLQANTTFDAFFKQRVGITDASDVAVRIQPNPATAVANLTIEGIGGNVDVAIIDLNGRVVSRRIVNADSTVPISLEGLARGTYFVRLTNSRFSKVEKLIVR